MGKCSELSKAAIDSHLVPRKGNKKRSGEASVMTHSGCRETQRTDESPSSCVQIFALQLKDDAGVTAINCAMTAWYLSVSTHITIRSSRGCLICFHWLNCSGCSRVIHD